ncbi:hypothetical protein ACFYWS_39005 [Streptomyces sp. NPDC002795]|uniref:hypothetical protein n=1 Tax=Streptomyces sp. NPDC002795 TaxID=3364665 RepID=UPI0036A269FD
MTGEERVRTAGQWLLPAVPDPRHSRWDWTQDAETLLCCGMLVTALPIRRTKCDDDAFLAQVLDGGPVIAADNQGEGL